MLRPVRAFILLSALLLVSGCIDDDLVDPWQAQLRIGIVTEAKYKQCDQTDRFFLPIFGKVKEPDLRSCEAAILAESCPLKAGIPLFCLNLYTGGGQ